MNGQQPLWFSISGSPWLPCESHGPHPRDSESRFGMGRFRDAAAESHFELKEEQQAR